MSQRLTPPPSGRNAAGTVVNPYDIQGRIYSCEAGSSIEVLDHGPFFLDTQTLISNGWTVVPTVNPWTQEISNASTSNTEFALGSVEHAEQNPAAYIPETDQ
jgi:hypothetical protein